MKNFDDFRRATNYQTLEISDGVNLYNQIVNSLPDDDRANKMMNELIKGISDYAEIACKWYTMEISSRVEKDKTRTVYHESLIYNINAMKKFLQNAGVNVGFFKVIEDEDRVKEKKKIGDFACIVYGILGIISR